MRILHCIPTLQCGGAERQLSYLAPELSRMGHEVHVAFIRGGINLARLDSAGVILHHLSSRSLYDPRIFVNLFFLIKKLEPDIIQTWLPPMDILGGLAARILGKPWVLREPVSPMMYPKTLKIFFRNMIGQSATAIISNSANGDGYWQSLGYRGERYIIPNALPVEEIEQEPPGTLSEFGLDTEQKFIIFAGRMDREQKNVMNLFYSLLPIVTTMPIIAVLCGDGPCRPILGKLSKEHGVSGKILLPGVVNGVWSLMKRAELLISVSNFEGCPNVVLEAMACGCPLVVSDIPEHREFLNEESALFANPQDPEGISGAILKLLSTPEEAQKRARIAKSQVERWTMSAMARRYEEGFIAALAKPKRTGHKEELS